MNRGDALRSVATMITGEKNKAHGEPMTQLAFAYSLKAMVRCGPAYGRMTMTEREALDTILVKVSRLAYGSPSVDNWLDIAGYAGIAVEANAQPADVIAKAKEKHPRGKAQRVVMKSGKVYWRRKA